MPVRGLGWLSRGPKALGAEEIWRGQSLLDPIFHEESESGLKSGVGSAWKPIWCPLGRQAPFIAVPTVAKQGHNTPHTHPQHPRTSHMMPLPWGVMVLLLPCHSMQSTSHTTPKRASNLGHPETYYLKVKRFKLRSVAHLAVKLRVKAPCLNTKPGLRPCISRWGAWLACLWGASKGGEGCGWLHAHPCPSTSPPCFPQVLLHPTSYPMRAKHTLGVARHVWHFSTPALAKSSPSYPS